MKPLFIPLKKHFYFAFWTGAKTTEYRLYSPRWCERTCFIGRPVTLSLGYGKSHRLPGVITDFKKHSRPWELSGWKECYGRKRTPAACIIIKIDRKSPEAARENLFWFRDVLGPIVARVVTDYFASKG